MSKTLLNGINAVLQRAQILDSGAALASLSDDARQVDIDIIIQAWNEAMEELFSIPGTPKPNIMGNSSITLVTSTRAYALASDLVRIVFPLRDTTNGRHIHEYPGGYTELVRQQLFPANWTGVPEFGAIRPSDGYIYLDRIPTANENGDVFTYDYEKDASLSSASDTFPFSDAVFRALMPAAYQIYIRETEQKFDDGMFAMTVGRASRLLIQTEPRDSWLPIRITNLPSGAERPFD